ncbi:MAG: hypothetical protein LBL90_06330 [Prevotellaceae bacterium]|jgi:hypothetical protein|nr:hypothetical protein [Prevotellaceae bacterium]
MRKIGIYLSIALLLLAIVSCTDDNDVQDKVILETTTFSGKTGDDINIKVTVRDGINKLVVTKHVNGKQVEAYNKELALNNSEATFFEPIEVGDEVGTLVYSFTGYNISGAIVDISDLLVNVILTDLALIAKYDWLLVEETVNGEASADITLYDNVYRMHEDLSWQYDWGISGPVNFENLNQFCAWAYTGSDIVMDSIFFIHYGFLSNTPTYTKWKKAKLEGTDLWLMTVMDLSWLGGDYTTETPVIQKYAGISKSSDFTPYRGEPAENYNWATCEPGSY